MKTLAAYFLLLCVALTLQPEISKAQTITINSVSPTHFCPGEPFTVTFTVTGYWQHRNAFTLQLSGTDGSFTNFYNIKSIVDTLPGTFTIIDTFPNATASSHYRFRIVSAFPYKVSADNGSDISIGNIPTPDFVHDLPNVVAVGTKITFVNNDRNLYDTLFWDFGSGANPPTAVSGGIVSIYLNHDLDKQGHEFSWWDTTVFYSQSATFLTPGQKTVTLRARSPQGCWSAPQTYTFQVFDCTYPAIPSTAIVVNADTMISYQGFPKPGTYWVNPGVKFTSEATVWDTIFAEAGSTIQMVNGAGLCYMKPGSALYSNDSWVLYADGANVIGNFKFSLKCPTLDFDYSSAPPNVAFPAAVKEDLNLATITLSPNPTHGLLQVQGLPTGHTSISVFNVLGESVIARKDVGVSACSMDLSKLAPGFYYMRFASSGSVLTKKIIKE